MSIEHEYMLLFMSMFLILTVSDMLILPLDCMPHIRVRVKVRIYIMEQGKNLKRKRFVIIQEWAKYSVPFGDERLYLLHSMSPL